MLFLVVDERVSREGEYMKEGIGSAVVPSYRELVEQLDSAKKLKRNDSIPVQAQKNSPRGFAVGLGKSTTQTSSRQLGEAKKPQEVRTAPAGVSDPEISCSFT